MIIDRVILLATIFFNDTLQVLNEYFTKEQMKEDGTIVPMTTIVTTPMVDDHHPEQPGMDSQQQAMHQDSTM